MGISEARHAAQAKKLEVVSGGDPNEEKRKVTRDAAIAARAGAVCPRRSTSMIG